MAIDNNLDPEENLADDAEVEVQDADENRLDDDLRLTETGDEEALDEEEERPEPEAEDGADADAGTDEPQEDEGDDEDTEEERVDQPPTAVEDYMPAIAKRWAELSEEDREAVREDLMAQLDKGEPSDSPDEAEREDESSDRAVPAQSSDAEPSAPQSPLAGAWPAQDVPELVTDSEVAALTEVLADEPEAEAAIRKLAEAANYAVRTTVGLGDAVTRAIEEQRDTVLSIRDEHELNAAIDSCSRDLVTLARKDYDAVLSQASQMKKAGRVSNWKDAIQLALLKRNGATTDSRPKRKLQRTVEKVAANLGRSGRTRRRMMKKNPPVFRDIEEVAREFLEQEGG